MFKRIFLPFCFITLLMLGCAEENSNPSLDFEEFSPPSWLIGTWNGVSPKNTIKFVVTTDNVTQVLPTGSSSFKDTFLDEITTDTADPTAETYLISYSPSGIYQYYNFEKTGDNTMTVTVVASGSSTYKASEGIANPMTK